MMRNLTNGTNRVCTFIIIFSSLLLLSSCSSDDSSAAENDFADNIVGAWSPVGFCNLDYIFYSDGTFEYDSFSWDYSGRYNITDGKTLEIIGESSDSESQRVTIVKLTSDEMIWKNITSGEEKQFVRAEDCN